MEDQLTRRGLVKVGGAAALAVSGIEGLLGADRASALTGIASATPKKGGTLNCGVGQVLTDINPFTAAYYRWTQLVELSMYEPLIKLGEGGKLIPVLATSWSHSSDYKTWTFKLRRGVRFHTGAEMTSADVAYCLNHYHSKPGANTFPVKGWKGATARDRYTVVVKLSQALNLPQSMRLWFILPKDSANLADRLQTESMGTGPFVLRNFVKGDRIEVVANTRYWDQPRPYLSRINFVFVPNISTAVANFLSGTLNMLHDVDVLSLKQVQGKRNSKVVNGGIFFHWWDPQMLFGPLQSAEARVALYHAFNRKKLNQVAWAGRGVDTWNPFDKTPYSIKKRFRPEYDLAKARRMLKAAGVAGQTVNLNVLEGSKQSSLEAQVLVEDLKAVGLKSKIVPRSSTAWFSELFTKRTGTGLYNNYAGGIPFPYSQILGFLFRMNVPPFPPKYRRSPVPALHRAMTGAENAYTNAQLSRHLKAAQNVFLAQAPAYHTFLAPLGEVVPRNFQGMETTTIGDVRLGSAYFS